MTAAPPRRATTTATCLVGLFAAGCYTTTNVARLEPLHTAYPVSASAQYVDGDGQIVTENEYSVVQPFSFDQRIEAPRHGSAHTALVLQPDLDRIVAASRGDAITKLKLQAIDYDVGSHRHAAGWKQFGWLFGVTGLLGITAGVARGGDNGTVTAEVSAGIAGFGVALYLLGASLQTPASWQLEVSGQVVRRTTPAPAPESPGPPPPSPPPPSPPPAP
jgi:hypothetical protein